MISVIFFKMGKHSDFHLSVFQIVVAWRDFSVFTKLMKNFKSLYGFGGRCLKIRDVCMDFESYLKVHNLVSVHPKSTIIGQMIDLDMIFHVMVLVYRLVKIWNSPQFPAEFRNGLLTTVRHYSPLFATVRHHLGLFAIRYSQLFAIHNCSLFTTVRHSLIRFSRTLSGFSACFRILN